MLTARSMSAAKRHAPWREPTQDETNAAVPELREIAGDRPDLLAEVARSCSAPVRAGSTSRDRRLPRASASPRAPTRARFQDGPRRVAAGSRSAASLRPATRPHVRHGAADGVQEAWAPRSSKSRGQGPRSRLPSPKTAETAGRSCPSSTRLASFRSWRLVGPDHEVQAVNVVAAPAAWARLLCDGDQGPAAARHRPGTGGGGAADRGRSRRPRRPPSPEISPVAACLPLRLA
jgi:hypothetical protein